jgi:hypothetical protein
MRNNFIQLFSQPILFGFVKRFNVSQILKFPPSTILFVEESIRIKKRFYVIFGNFEQDLVPTAPKI